MNDSLNHGFSLPPEQQAIRDKCFHPSGALPDFPKDEVEGSIPERFDKIVWRYPERPAVKVGNQVVTYAAINDLANRMAHSILERRGGKSEPIALMLKKGSDQIAAMLGVLKAGKILIVVDPLLPNERIRTMLLDAQVAWLVCDSQTIEQAEQVVSRDCDPVDLADLDWGGAVNNPRRQIAPATLGCIIYTSGTTGQPKGILQNHRNMLHTTWIRACDSHACHLDRVADLTAGTANSIFDMLLAVLSGATLLPFDIRSEGVGCLARRLTEENVSLCWISSRLFRTFCLSLTGTEQFPSLRFLKLRSEAGRKDDLDLFKRHFPRQCIFGNGLSSSETGYLALYSMDHECAGIGEELPVGFAVEDKEMRLLDDSGNEVGSNVVGEIVVRSRYLSPGYWRRPDLTEAKFKLDPQDPEKRLYYTGDLALRCDDGCLIHKGRKDFRVKIRGYGVEVAEVETVLREHPSVIDAIVVARKHLTNEERLVGYFTCPEEALLTVSELRSFLRKKLAEYMVPSALVRLETLPLTANGKIDRTALPDPGRSRPELAVSYAAPRAPIEMKLAEIWSDVLNIDQIGVHDNFFDLGGHSLVASRVISRVIQTFQLELPVKALFDAPTVAEMAAIITQNQAKRASDSELAQMLREVEAMSEEEAQKLLAVENARSTTGDGHE